MAGPDGLGDLAQAHVTEAVDDEVVHHLIDELLLRALAGHVPNGHPLRGGHHRGSEASWDLQVIEHELTAKAPPATVFSLLLDGSTWPSWSPIDSFELPKRRGDGEPEGVGAVRIFAQAGTRAGSG